MKVRLLFFRNIIQDVIKSWKIVCAMVLILGLAFTAFGSGTVERITATGADKEAIAVYEETLANYDNTLAEYQANLEATATEVANWETYISSSPYMQLDPDHIWTVDLQYAINSENIGNQLQAYINYVNEGGLKEAAPDAYSGMELRYFRELVGIYASNNMLVLNAYCPTQESANEVSALLDSRIQAYKADVTAVHGEHELVTLENTIYEKTDVNVLNTQNSYRDTLKNYTNQKVDYENRVINQKAGRLSYMENNAPSAAVNPGNRTLGAIIKFFIFGAILGGVIPVAFFAIRYILSDRIRRPSELRNLGIKCYGSSEADTRNLMKILKKIHGMESIYVLSSDDNREAQQIFDMLKDVAEAEQIKLVSSSMSEGADSALENTEQILSMAGCGCALMIVDKGVTSVRQVAAFADLCKEYDIRFLGTVM